MSNLSIITAGAGSGKTYRITEEVVKAFGADPSLEPRHLIVTTFTKVAAQELRERVAERLLQESMYLPLASLHEARIGTVHSVCQDFLAHYGSMVGRPEAFTVLSEVQANRLWNELLDQVNLVEKWGLLSRIGHGPESFRKQVEEIVKKAQVLNVSDLQASRDRLIEEFQSWFSTEEGSSVETIHEALQEAEQKMATVLEEDATIGTARYGNLLRSIANASSINYADYHRLANSEPRNAGLPVKQFIDPYLADHIKTKQFQEDYCEYLKFLFDTAQELRRGYLDLKKSKGLVDFNDLETGMTELLSEEAFREEFGTAIRWVLVDEFQDTSPVQLQIFKAWRQLADQSIWVGDLKQSIYGFRDADLPLIQQAFEEEAQNLEEPLDISRRSRPKLVHAANEFFKVAFRETLPENQIVLHPWDEIRDDDRIDCFPAISELRLLKEDGFSNVGKINAGIAKAVLKLVFEEHLIFAHQESSTRPIVASDIAVLCRSNAKVIQLSTELRALGIPVSTLSENYFQSAAFQFLEIVIGFIINPYDRWYTGLLRYFDQYQMEGEAWIRGLLNSDAQNDRWIEDRSALEQQLIDYLSENKAQPFPHFMAGLSEEIDLVNKMLALDPNFEAEAALEALAVSFEAYASEEQLADGLWALSEFQQNLEAQVRVHFKSYERGVTIMTYHGAKGLEWPVVFLTGLSSVKEPSGVLGASPVAKGQGEVVQIEYYPSPYGDLRTNLPLEPFLSTELERRKHEALEEEKRLFYVAFTRARESVVLVKEKSDSLPALDYLLVGQGSWQSLFREGAGEDLAIFPFDPELSANPRTQIEVPLIDKNPGVVESYFINPSAYIPPAEKLTIGEPQPIGERREGVTFPAEAEEDFGHFVHQYLAFGGTESLIEDYGLTENLDLATLANWRQTLENWLQANYPHYNGHHEVPFQYAFEGQMMRGVVDLVLESDTSLVFIDHKTFPGGVEQLKGRISEKGYHHQLAAYAKAMQEIKGKKVEQMWVHFPVSGCVVEVRFE
ncbi:MAG: UvrD-helicase domain-containing protein [Bacteroidetes bacterium]|nr:UvrD-helicase domain-containing protein [Bacteroidota bacterium]